MGPVESLRYKNALTHLTAQFLNVKCYAISRFDCVIYVIRHKDQGGANEDQNLQRLIIKQHANNGDGGEPDEINRHDDAGGRDAERLCQTEMGQESCAADQDDPRDGSG